MPPHLRHGGQCIYCAFRARRLALQSLRLPRCSSKRSFHWKPLQSGTSSQTELKIRQVGARGSGNRVIRTDPKFRKFVAKESDDGIIRIDSRKSQKQFTFGNLQRLDFNSQLERRLEAVKKELQSAPSVEQLRRENTKSGLKAPSFEQTWKEFAGKFARRQENTPFLGVVWTEEDEKTRIDLRHAYTTRGINGLDDRLRYAFYSHLINPRFTKSDINNQRALADLRYPSEWFPATRKTPRTVHLHVGPTNSGKTYHALQRLEQAESGVYAGPLRLLAHEVYTRMNAKGRPCSLVTGEERRIPETEEGDFGQMAACTVEMMPLNRVMDVAVIDEIQMIGNAERGWAWTQAFLGVRAKEIHLCGEDRTVPLVTEICASLGEKLHIHRYERLTPLEMDGNSLNGRLKDLRKGDCVVSFSVMGIHALRQQIERTTGKKVATVYGSLPPETRAQQARLFNDPDNEYDYLVASDAVGMGLNLAIKRIVFETSNKFDGYSRRTLGVADIKQIAGRAGRYKIATFKSTEDENNDREESLAKEDLAAAKGEAAPMIAAASETAASSAPAPAIAIKTEDVTKGLVTTLEKFDYPVVRAAMSAQPEPIRSGGIFPPSAILERFASYFPPYTPFSYIVTRLHEISQIHPRFHLCGLKDQVWLADLIEHVKGLTVTDRNIICSCPASMTDKELWIKLMPALAKCVSEQTGGAIYDIEELPLEVLEAEVSASRGYLRELEQLHKGIVGYLWLSYRFAGVFYTRGLAFHVKSLVKAKIEEVLSKFSFTEAERRRLAAMREKQLTLEMAEAAKAEAERQSNEPLADDESGRDDDQRPAELDLQEQTSLTSGGDHFGGEGDVTFEEPLDEEDAGRETTQTSTFSQWRERETRPLDESRDAEAVEFSHIVAEAEHEALQAAANDELEAVTEDRPSVSHLVPEVMASELSTYGDDKALNSEQDPTHNNTPIILETELESPPSETQQAPPLQSDVPNQKPAGFGQFSAGAPPKHLAQLDVDAKHDERDWASRP